MAYGSYPTKSVRLNQNTKERQMSKFKVGDKIEWLCCEEGWEGPYTVATDGKAYIDEGVGYLCLSDPPENYRLWEPTQDNPVESPSHYGKGKIECIEYIRDFLTKEEYIGYLRGNIAKYMHRWRYKNGEEDLKKARWYLEELIKQVEGD
jgi:hypothetical protein